MASPSLSVNLQALRANYQLLKSKHAKQNIASVVKANAYGLGVEHVSKALANEGCQLFFVATLEEAFQLRSYLPQADIAVFNGIFAGEEKTFAAHTIIPVINEPGQLEYCKALPHYFLHIDTGMTRLGFSATDLQNTKSLAPKLILSHLACANDPTHPHNEEQLARLKDALTLLPNIPVSFANSSGHFLADTFHFDIGRPGCALYGINPTMGRNPMQHVATLSAPILQIRTLDRDEAVGYGATCDARKSSRLAVTAMGYADGFFRSLSNHGFAFVEGHKAPILGRISMDMITLDVSAVPESAITPTTRAEFINDKYTVDDMANACDTIGYEIFTRIGRRVERAYS